MGQGISKWQLGSLNFVTSVASFHHESFPQADLPSRHNVINRESALQSA